MPTADNVHISAIDFDSRKLGILWSPVAPDCPAIHYNILASNCGSCPTTTNHTNATCTDISSNSRSKCTFAVQTVACENITGNTSEPISIIFYKLTGTSTDSQHPTETQGAPNLDSAVMVGAMDNLNSDTNIAYTISIGFLIATLIVCVVVSITVIAVVWRRSKVKIKAALESQCHGVEGTIGGEPTYVDITGPLPSFSMAINTQDNVAYGHVKTATPKESQQ